MRSRNPTVQNAPRSPTGRALGRPLSGALLVPLLLLAPAGAAHAQHAVSGLVTSASDGQPIPGVSIVVQGTEIGTLTGSNGRYTLAAPSGDATLVFSFIGYATRAVPIESRPVVNVALETEAVGLQEIVVVGYGTQTRRDVTGAVASVDGDLLDNAATPSVAEQLQGKVAGVQVIPASGEPGADPVIRIRGVGTLNDASPLFVVDGMLLDDIGFLSPNDIESIEVLKDASATSIYGSRGANGVIIVTTKSGVIEQPTQFRINAYAGSQEVLDPIDLVNAQQYAVLANELAANQDLPDPYFDDPAAVGPGVDWQDAIFESAPIQSYQLSMNGGSERITYYFSGNLLRQAGVLPKSDYDRLTLRLNNDYQLTDRLLLGHNINFSHTEGQQPANVFNLIYRADPTIAPRDEDGEFNNANVRSSAGNPAATVFFTNNEESGNRLVGNLFADYNFLAGFTLRSSFGLDYDDDQFRSFVPVFVVSPQQQNTTSNLLVETENVSSWLWENTLNYNYSSDRHRVNALAGVTAQSFYFEELGGRRTDIVGSDENLWYLNAGDEEGQTNFNSAEDWRMLSFLFRTNYSLLDRYLVTVSLRADGSSRFSEGNRYGYFPSVAIGWNLHEESFFDFDAVSALKLRGSWGEIGNDKIGAYPGIPIVTGNLNAVFGPEETLTFGASPIELANPQVKWEVTRQTNIGADMALLDGRLGATVDWYHRLTDGILVQIPIPRFVGVSTEPFVNAAEVLNTGLEGSLNWADALGDITYEFGINGSTLENEVKALGGGREQILSGGLGNETSVTTRTVVGQPIGSFWGFRVDGVFQTPEEVTAGPTRGGEEPGDLRFMDLSGPDGEPDGIINDLDKTFLGSPIPDFIYGFYGALTWGAFDVSASFSGQSGNELYNGKKAVRFGVENFEESYLDRWTGPGTSDTEPRVTNAGHNYLPSDRFIEDGSYLKLQSAQLGFRLPQSFADRLRVGSARLYVGGTNLFMLTDYTGYTPELVNPTSVIATGIDLGVFPTSRVITAGLDVTF
ncbi:MAG: SusC/RagA family TonB-linked outer membrane protein [Longimicrobiales bacterium]